MNKILIIRGEKMKKAIVVLLLVFIFGGSFISFGNDIVDEKGLVICPGKTKIVIRRSDTSNKFIKWYCASRINIINGVLEYTPINENGEIQKPHYLSPAIIWETCHIDDMSECFN